MARAMPPAVASGPATRSLGASIIWRSPKSRHRPARPPRSASAPSTRSLSASPNSGPEHPPVRGGGGVFPNTHSARGARTGPAGPFRAAVLLPIRRIIGSNIRPRGRPRDLRRRPGGRDRHRLARRRDVDGGSDRHRVWNRPKGLGKERKTTCSCGPNGTTATSTSMATRSRSPGPACEPAGPHCGPNRERT